MNYKVKANITYNDQALNRKVMKDEILEIPEERAIFLSKKMHVNKPFVSILEVIQVEVERVEVEEAQEGIELEEIEIVEEDKEEVETAEVKQENVEKAVKRRRKKAN